LSPLKIATIINVPLKKSVICEYLSYTFRIVSIKMVLYYGARIAQWYSSMGWMIRVSSHGRDGEFSHHLVQPSSATHPASYPVVTRGSFPGAKADYSPPSSAVVKKAWNYTSTPLTHLHGVVLG
jgi:hypothetical protein